MSEGGMFLVLLAREGNSNNVVNYNPPPQVKPMKSRVRAQAASGTTWTPWGP